MCSTRCMRYGKVGAGRLAARGWPARTDPLQGLFSGPVISLIPHGPQISFSRHLLAVFMAPHVRVTSALSADAISSCVWGKVAQRTDSPALAQVFSPLLISCETRSPSKIKPGSTVYSRDGRASRCYGDDRTPGGGDRDLGCSDCRV